MLALQLLADDVGVPAVAEEPLAQPAIETVERCLALGLAEGRAAPRAEVAPDRVARAAEFPRVSPPNQVREAAPSRQPLPPQASRLPALVSAVQEILPNTPAYDHFPFAIWQNCVSRQTRRAYRDNMGYAEPAGFEPLRRAIASYLALHRGDACDLEQVIITPGAHAAFMIAAQLLTNPGDGLLFEDPGPFIARHLFASLGRRLVHVPVDAEGMYFEAALVADRQVRLAFVMPSRQHPLGRTLSLAHRLRLLD